MTRVKRGTISMKRRRKVLKLAKGFRFGRSTKEIEAKIALIKAGAHAFAHRKDKKADKRRLWQVQINAAVRPFGLSYSKFIDALKKKNIIIDRKILADVAGNNPETFARFMKQVTA
ncbi:50S ribosomal protein L20 [Candidatus Nomurabacteria bacterium]|jgi:large subunit ribosomal protein L20|nr:50S ribosomal protein L20 [Candidatus Paceibacterota bacterium]MCC6520663.1 50S ribosomal protein L20 [Candidatus Nomurabacteria bacterium]